LLAAALALTVLTDQYPFVDAWVTAKVFGLIAYIILGSLALKAGRTQRLRIAAWLAAFALWGARNAGIYVAPRIDGRPG
jgi:uncharacterized membrane protein SirB2